MAAVGFNDTSFSAGVQHNSFSARHHSGPSFSAPSHANRASGSGAGTAGLPGPSKKPPRRRSNAGVQRGGEHLAMLRKASGVNEGEQGGSGGGAAAAGGEKRGWFSVPVVLPSDPRYVYW